MRVKYKPVCCGDELTSKVAPCTYRQFLKRHLNFVIVMLTVIALASLYLSGVFTFLVEEEFNDRSYPLQIDNIRGLVEKIDRFELEKQTTRVDYNSIVEALEAIHAEDATQQKILPLTQFKDFNFTIDIKPTCEKQWELASQQHLTRVAIVVKSAVNNYARRQAIRNSWYLNKTQSLFTFKTAFIVGKCHEKNVVPSSTLQLNSNRSWSPDDCEQNIVKEASGYGDIIQSSGVDSYYNNTIKTYMTLRWLNERCRPDFTLTIDDDYVFEVENFVDYMLELALTHQHETVNATLALNYESSNKNSTSYTANLIGSSTALHKLSEQYLWAGYLRSHPRPLRSVLSKWYISRKEYPYNKYPPFITGGAVLMSFKTVKHLYYATYFTRSFKFDDVYVGILAHKLGLTALHSDNFMCSLSEYMQANPIRPNSTHCLGVHDIQPDKLVELWQVRKQL